MNYLRNISRRTTVVSSIILAIAALAGGTYTAFAVTPTVPTNLAATSGNTSISLTWTAPTTTGNTPISDYIVERSPAGANTWTTFADGTSAATNAVVTGLTNGTAYDFRVSAVNSDVDGFTTSAPSATVTATPYTIPSAPTAPTAVRGNAQATISFTAPSNGGSAITSYTVTSSPGNFTGTGSASPITVTGLTNGTAYTFTVTATNAAGSGPASAASAAVIPATVPGAPTAVTATRGNAQAAVAFTAPASTGGATITGYTVTSSPGGFTGTGTTSPITVTGLTNGTAYTFTVTATNAVGNGTASTASTAVTPATVPSAPATPTVVAGNASAVVSFVAPVNGGSAITGYTVTSSPGGLTGTGTTSPITVTGLTNGTAYTFTVTATNVVGTSTASTASLAATPIAVPDAPTGLTATQGDSYVDLTWTAPALTGGSALTDYRVEFSLAGANSWSTFVDGVSTTTAARVTGLTNGTAYDFRVSAINAVGTGTPSATVTATPAVVTPAPVVGAPNTGLKSENIFVVIASGIGGIVLLVSGIVLIRRVSTRGTQR